MEIARVRLGQIDHKDIEEIRMISENGMEVDLISWGAAVRRIFLPDRNGFIKNVVLGYQDWRDYEEDPLYAGAVLCPNAGRISGALLPIGGDSYKLTANDGSNNLHGGFQNAAHCCWETVSLERGEDSCAAVFKVSLADGLDGFPGSRSVHIRYTLRNPMTLEIDMEAVSDRPTYFNLSNHSYFNLSGDFARSALDQTLEIYGKYYVANDREHLPVHIKPCAGTAFDFSNAVSLRKQMEAFPDEPQLSNAAGYNNAFLLENHEPGVLKKAAVLMDAASGRSLSLYTDAPSVVLYSGGYIGSGRRLFPGILSADSCALAMEAQDVPDTPHFCPDRTRITGPGSVYRRRIVYKFTL